MTEFVPYTYLIGWTKLNRWYYGVEYANNAQRVANPRNLFNTYFTSSKLVAKMIDKHGNPDVVSIRKTFVDSVKAREWEHRALRRLHVVHDDRWLNQTDNKAISFTYTEEYLAKLRKPKSKYTMSDKVRQANAARGLKMRGKKRPTRTNEWSSRISNGRAGLIWITDGSVCKQIKGTVPDGWRRGRK